VAILIDVVVFDLADVLLEFRGVESVARLSAGRIGPAEFARFWRSRWADALYKGECSPEEFAAGAVVAFGLAISPGAFLREFRTWLRGPYPGALELVADVRERAGAACLSNTNCLDVVRFRDELQFDRRFDYCFFSNEIGQRKPDAACFAHVLRRLGLSAEPRRVVFFDDSSACVRGARDAGMLAYQSASVASLRSHLERLGVLEGERRLRGA
jgi:HAD superfamily hydrolase (TIGR01509 family)